MVACEVLRLAIQTPVCSERPCFHEQMHRNAFSALKFWLPTCKWRHHQVPDKSFDSSPNWVTVQGKSDLLLLFFCPSCCRYLLAVHPNLTTVTKYFVLHFYMRRSILNWQTVEETNSRYITCSPSADLQVYVWLCSVSLFPVRFCGSSRCCLQVNHTSVSTQRWHWEVTSHIVPLCPSKKVGGWINAV